MLTGALLALFFGLIAMIGAMSALVCVHGFGKGF